MEQIPEINDLELYIKIAKRYHGTWEVSIFYASEPVKRYTIGELAGYLFLEIYDKFPKVGTWMFSRKKAEETLSRAYADAINSFMNRIKMDVANVIWDKGHE